MGVAAGDGRPGPRLRESGRGWPRSVVGARADHHAAHSGGLLKSGALSGDPVHCDTPQGRELYGGEDWGRDCRLFPLDGPRPAEWEDKAALRNTILVGALDAQRVVDALPPSCCRCWAYRWTPLEGSGRLEKGP